MSRCEGSGPPPSLAGGPGTLSQVLRLRSLTHLPLPVSKLTAGRPGTKPCARWTPQALTTTVQLCYLDWFPPPIHSSTRTSTKTKEHVFGSCSCPHNLVPQQLHHVPRCSKCHLRKSQRPSYSPGGPTLLAHYPLTPSLTPVSRRGLLSPTLASLRLPGAHAGPWCPFAPTISDVAPAQPAIPSRHTRQLPAGAFRLPHSAVTWRTRRV